MEICYKRNLARSYMCITVQEEWDEFEQECLQNGRIDGLLPVKITKENGRTVCWYDITGKQALDRMLELEEMSAAGLTQLLGGLCDLLQRTESYLLRPEHILLLPECIFGDREKGQFWFCYGTPECTDMQEDFKKMMEYLLTRLDHKDTRAVKLAYHVYEEVKNPSYSLLQIRESLSENQDDSQQEEKLQQPEAYETVTEMEDPFPVTEKSVPEARKNRMGKLLKKLLKRFFPDYFKLFGKKKEEEPAVQQIVFEPEEEPVKRGRPTVLLSEANTQIKGILKYEGSHHLPDLILDTMPYIVGSATECNGRLASETVSRMHARFTKVNDIYFLEDLNSANGTKIGGRELDYRGKASIQKNEVIEFADEKFRFI